MRHCHFWGTRWTYFLLDQSPIEEDWQGSWRQVVEGAGPFPGLHGVPYGFFPCFPAPHLPAAMVILVSEVHGTSSVFLYANLLLYKSRKGSRLLTNFIQTFRQSSCVQPLIFPYVNAKNLLRLSRVLRHKQDSLISCQINYHWCTCFQAIDILLKSLLCYYWCFYFLCLCGFLFWPLSFIIVKTLE